MLWILGSSLAVLLSALLAVWTAPRWLVARLAARWPDCLFCVSTNERVVALTLDDGPDAATTPEILEVLGAHGVRATFFLISERVAGCEALVSAIVAQGHELGNHLTRDEASIRLPAERFESAAREAGVVLERFARVRWLRPGSAWFDQTMLDTIQRLGYRCALGSVYPLDPHVPSSRFASSYILTNVRPGSVIVLHECGARGTRTAETLRRVLPRLRARGYRVTTLTELEHLCLAKPG